MEKAPLTGTFDEAATAPPIFSSAASPLIQSERIQLIDALRGVALLGILLMNIPFFALPLQVANDLNLRNEYSGPNYYTFWIVSLFFEGSMRGMFSILFGAGSILLISRLEKKHTGTFPADLYYRRLIWLLIFGLINAFIFLWPGDILYSYAICGLFIFPFRKMAPKYLFMFGIFLMLIMNLKNTLSFYDLRSARIKGENAVALDKKNVKLTDQQKKDKANYEGRLERLSVANQQKEAAEDAAEYHKGYFSLMAFLKNANVHIQSTMFYNNYFWDVLAFFFFGMALFKLGILTGERSTKFYVVMSVVGYAIGLTLSYLITRNSIDVRFDRSRFADKLLFDYYDEKRLFLSLGHIGLITAIYKSRIINGFFAALANVGQMAFTNYLMQSIFCATIFYGFGLNWFNEFQRYQIYYFVGAIWLFQIIFSFIWLRYFRFGPFEWLWRSLTYWKRQPMLKTKREAAMPLVPSL